MGSPLLAIESAMEHVNRGTLKPDVTINFIFVESNASHAAHLRKVLGELSPLRDVELRFAPDDAASEISAWLHHSGP